MRLIDADKLKMLPWENANDAAFDINNAPTIDAVPVVRCGQCDYLRHDGSYGTRRYCALREVNGGYFCKDDDFCSRGRRKDVEE